MAQERIRSGPDGLPLRDAATDRYSRPDLCPAAVRNGNLGCSHTTARLALMRAAEALEGEGAKALGEELRRLHAALGILDHRRSGAENRRADALLARDGRAAALAEDEIGAIAAAHRAAGLRVGHIRDLLLSKPGPPTLAGRRSRPYAGS